MGFSLGPSQYSLSSGPKKKYSTLNHKPKPIPFVTFLEFHIHLFTTTIIIHVSSSRFMPLLLSFLVCHHHHHDDRNIVQ